MILEQVLGKCWPSCKLRKDVSEFVNGTNVFMSPEKGIPKVGLNRAHRNPIYNAAMSDRDRNEREERMGLTHVNEDFFGGPMEKPGGLKYDGYEVLSCKRVSRTEAALHLEETYDQNFAETYYGW